MIRPLFFACLLLPACSSNAMQPLSTPAAQHPAYASQFPSRIDRLNQELEAELTWSSGIEAKFSQYPERLNDPSWRQVKRVYELADQDGRSAHFAHVSEETEVVHRFYREESDELVKLLGGTVTYQAKQDGCEAQLYGAVSRGLDKAVEKRVEERVADSSAAVAFIRQHEASIGPNNAEALQLQATEIALAAHTVFVAMAEHHRQLEKLVSQQETVQETLEKRQEQLEAPLEGEASTEQIEARKQELEAVTSARAELGISVEAARKTIESSQEAIERARDAYENAFEELLETIERRTGDDS